MKSFLTGRPFALEWIRESNLIEGIDDLQEDDICLEVWHSLPEHPWCQDVMEPWSTSMVLWIHKGIMEWLRPDIAGKTRTVNVTVGGFNAPGWPSVWHSLCGWVKDARSSRTEKEIRYDHILFEKIHPFEDGNGRTGRMLMNWQRVRAGLDPLLIKASERQEYYRWFR